MAEENPQSAPVISKHRHQLELAKTAEPKSYIKSDEREKRSTNGRGADEESESDNSGEDDENGVSETEEEDSEPESELGPESDETPVITLVEGRERRSTAGNRLSTLLDQEGQNEEDEVSMLFAEDGAEDVEFEDPDAAEISEADDDSSTDDEDQGPTAGEGDLEGEKQLMKEERNERKRKAAKPFLKSSVGRKRVKIDEYTTSSTTTAEPPSQKPLRVLKLRANLDAPKRTSSRTLSVQNKERTLASIKETEKRRMRQLAVLEATQKRKVAERNKPMTQEERLAEAARTEELNSRTVNKWEEMERDRMAKQKSRLEALQNRKLEGPVIRWYSGPAEWVNGELRHVGKCNTQIAESADDDNDVEEEKVDTNDSNSIKELASELPSHETNVKATDPSAEDTSLPVVGVAQVDNPPEKEDESEQCKAVSESKIQDVTDPEINKSILETDDSTYNNLIDDIYRYASMGDAAKEDEPENTTILEDKLELQKTETLTSPVVVEFEDKPTNIPESEVTQITSSPEATAMENDTLEQPVAKKDSIEAMAESTGSCTEANAHNDIPEDETRVFERAPTPVIEYSTRNLVSLINFDSNAVRDRDVQRRILFKWRHDQVPPTSHTGRGGIKTAQLLPAPRSSCAITYQSARYKDPETGLPYHNLEAYRSIRRLLAGGCKWSDLLGAWVGGEVPATDGSCGIITAATGVPPGFDRPLKSTVATATSEKEVDGSKLVPVKAEGD